MTGYSLTGKAGERTRSRVRDGPRRFFNTAGPMIPADHYHVPPLERLDLDELLLLIEQKRYSVMHAPRQTGKTSVLLALVEELNGSGRYRCAYVNVEIGQSAREDVMVRNAGDTEPDRLRTPKCVLDDRSVSRDVARQVLERRRPPRRAAGGAGPLGRGRRQASGAAHRRDRRADRRHPAGRPAATARRLPGAPAPVPAERRPVRRTGRARLPHPLQRRERRHRRRQRLQHPRRVPAPGRLHRGRGACAADAAHRGDRPGLHRGGPGRDLGADPGPALAGERAGVRSLLQEQGEPRPRSGHHRRGDPRRPGAAHPAPRDPTSINSRTSCRRSASGASSNPC